MTNSNQKLNLHLNINFEIQLNDPLSTLVDFSTNNGDRYSTRVELHLKHQYKVKTQLTDEEIPDVMRWLTFPLSSSLFSFLWPIWSCECGPHC